MLYPGHGHDRAQKVSEREKEASWLLWHLLPIPEPQLLHQQGKMDVVSPWETALGPAYHKHTCTEIMYTLTHMGGSLLGICPWITPSQLPRDTSPSSCPMSLKQNSILLECHGGLQTRCVSALTQGGQSLEGQGAVSWPSTEIKKRQMNTMWVSPSAIA